MNQVTPTSTTTNQYVQQYEALKGDHRPVQEVIAEATDKRVAANASDANRLRNRSKILGAVGATAAGLAVATAVNAGLINEAHEESKYLSGDAKKASVQHESVTPAEPGDPIVVEAQSAEPVEQEPNSAG